MPLDGIRVVEVGAFTAGPLGGRYLADLGAEVIKIEPPGGEDSRRWHPQFGGVSGYFATRSEEHTSELQSLMRISYAVFCLKKKTHKVRTDHNITNNNTPTLIILPHLDR